MKVYRFCLLLILVACATAKHSNYIKRFPSAETQNKSFQARLTEILTPYLAPLDRDLWTFRWEQVEKEKFNPKSVDDLNKRINSWANRFWNPNIVFGADTGPGVYVAIDPTATAVFGGEDPRLYTIKIKRGINMIIGDQHHVSPDVAERFSALVKDMDCGNSWSEASDVGHAIGYLRMNASLFCRQLIIDTLQSLSVKAISYGFNSNPVRNCRTTGTAISIIDSQAIAEINGYAADGNVEANSHITPYVKALYQETQNDFYSQAMLANLKTWIRFKKGFGFFDTVGVADPARFAKWKNDHILYCGPNWSIERENPILRDLVKVRTSSHLNLTQLLIELSLVYREKYEFIFYKQPLRASKLPARTPGNFNASKMRWIVSRVDLSYANLTKLLYGVMPTFNSDQDRNEKDYIKILKDCLNRYQSESFEDVITGECGMEPEKQK